jgi:hypothetical protein
MLASTLLLAVEVFRVGPRRTFLVACLCTLMAGRAAYELVRLFIHR